jgi:hypothetical protein
VTRQTSDPLTHHTLNPAYRTAHSLVDGADRGELDLDPPYQRGDVWTLDQRIALVQSWLRGLPAGVVYVSDRTGDAWADGGAAWEACVDGKQRITTARMWYRNEFAAPASWFRPDFVDTTEDTDDGPYVRHSGLTPKGGRFFERFASLLVAVAKECNTIADEAAFYLLVNGGGTAQSAGDMANAARVARN